MLSIFRVNTTLTREGEFIEVLGNMALLNITEKLRLIPLEFILVNLNSESYKLVPTRILDLELHVQIEEKCCTTTEIDIMDSGEMTW